MTATWYAPGAPASAFDAPPTSVVGYAPGSIGNFGAALDVLGAAVTGAGDLVECAWTARAGDARIVVLEAGDPALPTDPARHACALAATATWQAVTARAGRDVADDRALAIRVRKGLPLAGGQGGSAASAIAAVVATEALLLAALGADAAADGDVGNAVLDTATRLACGLAAERVVAGAHLDNLAPSLLGGVVTTLTVEPPDVARIPVARTPWFALVRPHVQVRTAEARAALPGHVSRDVAIAQMAATAGIVAGLSLGDLAFVGRSLVDRIAEPVRAAGIPAFASVMDAARTAGALAGAISGSGPTVFALCDREPAARASAEAMAAAFAAASVACDVRIATLDDRGACWRAGTLPEVHE